MSEEKLGQMVTHVRPDNGHGPSLTRAKDIPRDKSDAVSTYVVESSSGIDIFPSMVDDASMIVQWDFDRSLRYALRILNAGGSQLFESQPTRSATTNIPIAAIESYIGFEVQAILYWFDPTTKNHGIAADKWIQVPDRAAAFVWNYEEKEKKWMARYKKRRFFTRWRLEIFLLMVLFGLVFFGAYLAIKAPLQFHL